MEFLERISQAHGWSTAVIGICTVFVALTLVWLVTEAFSRAFRSKEEANRTPAAPAAPQTKPADEPAFDTTLATVAAIAAVIDEKKRRARAVATPAVSSKTSSWAMDGRLRAMQQRLRMTLREGSGR